MHNYQIGFTSFGRGHSVDLIHKNNYSQEEFDSICYQAIEKIFTDKIGDINFKDPKFGQIAYALRDVLIKSFGFKIPPDAKIFFLWRNSTITEKWDQENYRHKKVREIWEKVYG